MIKLKDLLMEVSDDITIRRKDGKQISIDYTSSYVINVFIVLKNEWYAYDTRNYKVSSENEKFMKLIELMDDKSKEPVDVSIRFNWLKTSRTHLMLHAYIAKVYTEFGFKTYKSYEDVERHRNLGGRIFEYEDVYYLTFWDEPVKVMKHKNSIDDMLRTFDIPTDKVQVEFDEKFESYNSYFGITEPRTKEYSDYEKSILKMKRDRHMAFAGLPKAWKDAAMKIENSNTIKLKDLLLEGDKENAALDYLSQLVKSGPFKGRVYLAGGAVRDMELGKDPKDLDVVVTGGIEAGMEFAKWATEYMNNHVEGSNPVVFPTFGTAKFTLKGITHNGIDLSDIDIESVATRKEKYTTGSRKPEVSAGDLADDVNRRDFTVNSLLKDLTTGEILDLTGKGKEDIKKGIVQTPLNPDVIFTDDPLRILRAARFAIKYGWDLPMFMIRAMKRNAPQLENISNERIRDELNKMLVTGAPHRAIKLLKITGILDHVMPEFKDSYQMTQNQHHKHTVFKHSLDVLSKTQPDLVQRLMGLFHDIGKVVTKSVTPTGVHFYGHEDEGEKMTRSIMFRLKYPTELINAVATGVKNHMRLKHGGDDAVALTDKTLRKFKMELGDNLENTLSLIHADNISHSEASSMPNQIDNVKNRLNNLNIPTTTKPKLPINGKDLIDMGIKPGPIFTKIMTAVTDKWFENPEVSREEAIEIAKNIAGK
jgi:poly(A) polymerase